MQSTFIFKRKIKERGKERVGKLRVADVRSPSSEAVPDLYTALNMG